MNKSSDFENKELAAVVKTDSDLKEIIVNYVGACRQPVNDEVTVEMVIDVFAEEFPEFVLALAEENYMRGYADGHTPSEPLADAHSSV